MRDDHTPEEREKLDSALSQTSEFASELVKQWMTLLSGQAIHLEQTVDPRDAPFICATQALILLIGLNVFIQKLTPEQYRALVEEVEATRSRERAGKLQYAGLTTLVELLVPFNSALKDFS